MRICNNIFSFALLLIEFPPLVNCVWGKFSEWGMCSVTCGDGKKSRSRTISTLASGGGRQCYGQSIEEKPCNERKCPGG